MIKKIILFLAIASPFILYFFYTRISNSKKKYPILKLSIVSIIFLILALGSLRLFENFSPNTKYSPPKYENGKLIQADNK